MSKYLVTEEQVKKALKIESFRNLSKDKVMEFISLIPNMDKDVAISIINQFPNFADFGINTIAQLNVTCDKVLKSNDESRKDAVRAYQTILDGLSLRLQRNDITDAERKSITQDMIDVADKVAELDEKNKKFLRKIFTTTASIVGGALIVGAAILGVKVKGTQIPTLDSDDDDDIDDDNIIDVDVTDDEE